MRRYTSGMLRVDHLSKSLPQGRRLFENVDLRLGTGECVAILGESGAGKSTLLNLIAGLDHADAGTIDIDGVRLTGLPERERTQLRRYKIGFVFQAFHLLPHLTLEENVALTLILTQHKTHDARQAARKALDEVGLGDRTRDYPRQISGGEMQRVAIARALAHHPVLLLADEPTGNLDAGNAARVLQLMQSLMHTHGTATVLVTHSATTAAIADRRLRLTEGGLVAP